MEAVRIETERMRVTFSKNTHIKNVCVYTEPACPIGDTGAQIGLAALTFMILNAKTLVKLTTLKESMC